MKKVLTFDIDNVNFDTNRLIEEYISSHGIVPRFDDWHYSYLPEDVRAAVYGIFYGEDIGKGDLTSAAAPYYIKEFGAEYDVYFVSARPKEQLWITIDQFARHNIDAPKDRLVLGCSTDKFAELRDLKTILHVDDSDTVIMPRIERNLKHCMISNYRTTSNHYLRPKARWAGNIDDFWRNRDAFLNYSMSGNGVRLRS
jgi:hypothetical protein